MYNLTTYADDTTLFVANENSAKEALATFNRFKSISSLNINKERSEVLSIGCKSFSNKKPLELSWSKEPIRALGFYFSYEESACQKCNFESLLRKIRNSLVF